MKKRETCETSYNFKLHICMTIQNSDTHTHKYLYTDMCDSRQSHGKFGMVRVFFSSFDFELMFCSFVRFNLFRFIEFRFLRNLM